MSFRIVGLPRLAFEGYFAMDDAALAKAGALRVTADADRGYPCRVSLEEARQGERLILINHVSNAAPGPYRAAHAIYVRENAREAPAYVDRLPPVLAGRVLSLRGFDRAGLLRSARLARGAAVARDIAALFQDRQVACIHAHNAAYGCFAAKIERHGDTA